MNLIKKYVSKRKGSYFSSVLFAILGVIAGLVSYIVLAEIITNLISNNMKINFYLNKILFILAALILKEVFSGISTAISHTATFHSLMEIRKTISEKLFKMPLGDVLEGGSGRLKDIIIDQVDHMETTLAHIIPEFTANLVGPIIILIYMLTIDWRLTLLSLIPLVIGMAAMKSVMTESYKENYKKSVGIGQHMNNSIVEYINGVEVIKAFNQSDKSYKKFSDAVINNAKFFYNWMGESMMKVSIGRLVSPMGLITILPFGLLFIRNGSLDISSFITIIVLSFATVDGILKVMNYVDDISRISTITGEIEGILNNRELIHNENNNEINSYNIEFQDVSFSYDENKKAIDNMSFQIEDGDVAAFVGPSGGGKSTIMKLLAGFWDADEGEIKIGGVDMKDISLEKLSDLISYVSQDNFLFDMSIMDNIRIGNPKATDNEVIEISKKSGSHEFIKDLPNGYETNVGTGGGHLSGGERQRISIARAMLKDAPIVVLDEATSYIDPENEAIIQDAIANLVKDKTLIMIAHRLRTVVGVEKIFLINNGKVESTGTHEELLLKSQLYQNMYSAAIKGDE